MSKGVLSAHTVAKRLQLDVRTVRYHAQKKHLKGDKKSTGWEFTEEALQEFQAERELKLWDQSSDSIVPNREFLKRRIAQATHTNETDSL